MSYTRRSADVVDQIAAQCINYPPEGSANSLDRRWIQLVHQPDAAMKAFTTNLEQFDSPTAQGESARLTVAAAVGGILVASESGNKTANAAWGRMQRTVNSRIGMGSRGTLGASIIQSLAHPAAGEIMGNQAGDTNLGLYLAASAIDEATYTPWKKPIANTIADGMHGVAQTTSSIVHTTSSIIETLRGHKSSSNKRVPAADSPADNLTYDTGHLDQLATHYLRKTLSTHGVSTGKLEAILAATYGVIVKKLGLAAITYERSGDPASQQLVEDFLSSCLRLSGTRDPLKTSNAIRQSLGSLGDPLASIFTATEMLFHKRGVPIKGPSRITERINDIKRLKEEARPTVVQAPKDKPLAAPHTEIVNRLGLHDAQGKPRDSGPPKINAETLGDRRKAKKAAQAPGNGRPTPVPPAPKQPSESSSEPKRQIIHPPRKLVDLLSGDMDHDIQGMPRRYTPMYPYSRILSAYAIRWESGVSASTPPDSAEARLATKINTLRRFTWSQLIDTGALKSIANGEKVRDDVFAGAVEVHRWLLQNVASGTADPQIHKAEEQFRQAISHHLRNRFGLPQHAQISLPLFQTLSEITTFELSGLRQQKQDLVAHQAFWKRILVAMFGQALTPAERAAYDRITRAAPNKEAKQIVREDLPPAAQDTYDYLQRRATTGYS